MSDIKKAELNEDVTKRIYLYSRGSQLDLLSCVPNTYMWVSPIAPEQLQRYGLVLRTCAGSKRRIYRDILVSKKEYKYTAADKAFIDQLHAERDRLESLYGRPSTDSSYIDQ